MSTYQRGGGEGNEEMRADVGLMVGHSLREWLCIPLSDFTALRPKSLAERVAHLTKPLAERVAHLANNVI